MSFFEQLLKDAQPKAETLKKATTNVATKVANSNIVKVSKNLGYKSLVNTVGIACVIVQPVVSKAWSKVEQLASDPKSVEAK